MARLELSTKAVDRVVRLREAGKSRAEVSEATGIDKNIVSAILSARGVSKSRPEVRRRDRKRLAAWLGDA